MTFHGILEFLSHLAAILTAVVAVLASAFYIRQRRAKRRRLEEYLEGEYDARRDQGQRTLMHLAANLGMTESEIMDAAFRSDRIDRVVTTDGAGRADRMMLVHKPKKP
ncbi:MAG: hypothetical protein AAF563_09445 [Pseudomonadota bacterium]